MMRVAALQVDSHQLSRPHLRLLDSLQALEQQRIDLLYLSTFETSLAPTSRSIVLQRSLSAEQQSRIDMLDKELDWLWRELTSKIPLLGPTSFSPPPDLSLVQQHLRRLRESGHETAILDIGKLQGRLVIFGLQGHDLEHKTISMADEDLAEWTQRLDHYFEMGRVTFERNRSAFDRDLNKALTWLSELLWPVLEELLPPGAEPTDPYAPHLLIIPPAALQRWPLHALPIPGTSHRLIDRYAIQLLPSSDSLPFLAPNDRTAHAAVPFTAFVPPTDLHYPFPEAHTAAHALGADPATSILTGANATHANLTQLPGGVVLFATHATMVLDHPDLSSIELAAPDGTPDRVSGLRLLAGFGGHHRFDLVVLAACEAHGSPMAGGDNWTGLTRALLGGTNQLVSSLWYVLDALSLALGVHFWQGIQQGLTPAQALRMAMRWVRDASDTDLLALGDEIAELLPASSDGGIDRETFLAAWRREHDDPYGSQPFYPGLSYWTPWIAIGHPNQLTHPHAG